MEKSVRREHVDRERRNDRPVRSVDGGAAGAITHIAKSRLELFTERTQRESGAVSDAEIGLS